MRKRLFDLLSDYAQSGMQPFHMPGHKRRNFDYLIGADLDITEIPGFDDLHDPSEILKESQTFAAAVFGAKQAFYLINGSTCGILAALYTVCNKGDPVLMARNCHLSVYNGVELLSLEPTYIYPVFDMQHGIYTSVTPQSVEAALQNCPDAAALVLTSPTYDGVTSDLPAICRLAHAHDVRVIVDAAHGAHFGFDAYFPQAAVASGADIVITSLHKTLPSLTGTALALLNDPGLGQSFMHSLSIFETSSPSYPMLASIDGCVHLIQEHGSVLFSKWADNLRAFRNDAKQLVHIQVLEENEISGAFGYDPGKLLLFCAGMPGRELYAQLRARGIEPEMYGANYVLAMTSPADDAESFSALLQVLFDIDKRCNTKMRKSDSLYLPAGEKARGVYAAMRSAYTCVGIAAARGKISAEYIYAYPPGIPAVVPGERITDAVLLYITAAEQCGIKFRHSISIINEIAVTE
ncbi:MAG: aminotransferase class I/II-fold pyridoxal phosphate-dependent enzyme [Clostridia bacterium]|nr:aminotransferase class I/II-fold pyridoxal phosphate-dependent enzyme [Clostridia bacterium]